MTERWSDHMAAALAGPDVRLVIGAVLEAVGTQLVDSRVRSVHRRGTSSVAVVHHVELTDGDGQRRERLYVTHASTRDVPAGAATVDVDGTVVHVWQFPHDPYLPGLRDAVHRGEAAALLERVDRSTGGAPIRIRTRSYRPTRRAVVELRADGPPLAYVKLLGGRDARRIRRRTRELTDVHAELLEHDVPVPSVLEHDEADGRVVLDAVPGATLRSALRGGGQVPPAEHVADLLQRLHACPSLPTRADPDGFADAGRHLRLLGTRLPERRDDLAEVAAAVEGLGGPRGTVHGDLHDGQLLVEDGAVTGVLDVDGAGEGFLANDVGRLLAHVEAGVLASPGDADRILDYVGDLRAATAGVAPDDDVARAAAAAWVGLATGPIRVASSDWRAEVNARIDRAATWARRAG